MAITSDSAANNGTFMSHLMSHCRSRSIFHFDRIGSRVNCFAHILNLSVQDLLKSLNRCVESNHGACLPDSDDEDDLFEDWGEMDDEATTNRRVPDNVIKKVLGKNIGIWI